MVVCLMYLGLAEKVRFFQNESVAPCLSAASSLTESDAPTLAYATVYPIAMVSLIIFVKIISWVFAFIA